MKTNAIVKLETRPHRTVAQENWGLTAEQMAGMEVHHRVPVSEGGTNDPSNLFVCSPSMHRWGWHDGEKGFGIWAAKGGRTSKGGHVTGKLPWWHNPETGKTTRSTGCPGEGWVSGRNPTLMADLKKHLVGGGNSHGQASKQHAQRWRCLVTGHISTPCGLSQWQSSRGIDKKLRERVA
jgi:hypothetical protein